MYSAQTTLTYKRRKDRKVKNNNKLILYIFLFFLLIAIISFFNSSLSKITELKINGISLLSKEDVYEQANVSDEMYYFLASKSKIKENLLELDEVKDVEVLKKFPGRLTINITEKKTLAFINIDDRWTPILEDGQLYYKYNGGSLYGHPLITNWLDINLIKKLAEELNKTSPSILAEISEIQQNPQENNQNQLLIFTDEGYRIHISLDTFSVKLNLYPEIRESIRTKTTKLGDIYLFESLRFEEFN